MMKRNGKRIAALLLALLLALGASCASAEALLRAGGSFGFAVDEKGVIWGWGDNTKGQLGNGTKKRQFLPVPVALGLDGSQIADIQCGNENTVFLMKDGTVYSCGSNNYGQQGVKGAPAYVFEPIQVVGLENVVQIAAGFGQCLARTADGRVYAWGRNNCGQIGNGQTINAKIPVLLALTDIVDIQCGGKFCMALDKEGAIWGWGDNESGQLLDASRMGRPVAEPARLNVSGQFTMIACGGSTAFGLDAEGVLWAWGKNDYWQMGTDDVVKTSAEPMRVELPEGIRLAGIAAYNTHIAAWSDDGAAWMWGCVYMGQSGTDQRLSRTTPISIYPSSIVQSAAVGSLQSYLLLNDGRVLASGYNKYGQCGTAGTANFYTTWQDTGLNLFTGVWEDQRNQ